jgi:prepilin-type N-terminal cleavage/methylation domain-containing protein
MHDAIRLRKESGFSLVELSIVIVIIGLIVSSVLVGQDLVRSAEIRALVSQYERFNKATATFKDKFSGLPGDIKANARFGFGNAATEADVAENGLLTDSAQAHADNDGEYVLFWNHLGTNGANLLEANYDGNAIAAADLSPTLPQAEAGGYWGAFSTAAGDNYYIYGATYNGSDATWATADVLSPKDAYNVDQKIDDGKPGRGIMQAQDGNGTNPLTAPANGATACIDVAGADSVYNVNVGEDVCTFSVLMRI